MKDFAAGIAAVIVATTGVFAAPAKAPVTAAEVRPPASALIDCAKAPKDAVTRLPDDLARWATIYCTRLGHIFNANDRHFGVFPDSGVRASISAGEMDSKTGEPGNDAYFSSIKYREMTPDEVKSLIALDPSVKRIYQGKQLWRLDLESNGGKTLSFLVINPSSDPFWVFPMQLNGIGSPAFFVTSLDKLNQAR